MCVRFGFSCWLGRRAGALRQPGSACVEVQGFVVGRWLGSEAVQAVSALKPHEAPPRPRNPQFPAQVGPRRCWLGAFLSAGFRVCCEVGWGSEAARQCVVCARFGVGVCSGGGCGAPRLPGIYIEVAATCGECGLGFFGFGRCVRKVPGS